ncbi:MAG: universal stress protein [Phycisphaerae bacterium]
MRERSLEEFESIFEQAAIPVLEIENVALDSISAVIRGRESDDAIIRTASYLATRFGSLVNLLWKADEASEAQLEGARQLRFTPAARPFASTAELAAQVADSRSRLVLWPQVDSDGSAEEELDALVRDVAPPVLLIHRPVHEPVDIFRKILHSLTGNFQQTRNFAYSFRLAETDATLTLLHAVAPNQLDDVREALRVSPDVAGQTGKELLEGMAHHGERFLKAVVAASRERPFNVAYRIAVGDVVPTVNEELARGGYTLLVVGSHRNGHSHIGASDYQLMHTVTEIPVLAL